MNYRISLITCVAALLLMPSPPAAAGAVIIYVDQDASSDNDGTSWATAYTSIQTAINAAVGGEEIWVAEGTYLESIDIDTRSGLYLYGGFSGTETELSQRDYEANVTMLDASSLSGFARYNVVLIAGSTNIRLDGFSLTGGDDEGEATSGGGLAFLNCDNTNTIANCRFFGNRARWGGGMAIQSSSPVVENCLFFANDADSSGGAVTIDYGSAAPVFRECLFVGNTSAFGPAGVNVLQAAPTFENCLFSGNKSNFSGAMRVDTSAAIVTNCTFVSCATVYDGNITVDDDAGSIFTNCLVAGNSGTGFWEVNETADATLSHNLFYGNTGGDYYDEGANLLIGAAQIDATAGATATVGGDPLFYEGLSGTWTAAPVYSSATNTTVLTDAAASYAEGSLVDQILHPDAAGYFQAWIVGNTATTITVAGDVSAIAANGGAYETFDYHLQYDSAARNAGTNVGAPAIDLDGDARPHDTFFDIGVDETYAIDLDGDPDGDGVITGDEINIYESDPARYEVWVDFAFTDEDRSGLPHAPYNSLTEALSAVPNGGAIRINGASAVKSSNWNGTITKKVGLFSDGGTISLGLTP